MARAAAALAGYLGQLRALGLTEVRFESRSAAAMLIGAIFTDAITREGLPDMYTESPEADVHQYVTIFLRGIGVSS
jgi:hypothetical protein